MSTSKLSAESLLVLVDPKTRALVRLAAGIAVVASVDRLRELVANALADGATDNEIVGTLGAIAAEIGIAGTVASVQGVALGLGYDVDRALEEPPIG